LNYRKINSITNIVPEMHYLQFDGITDSGIAASAVTGIGSEFVFAISVQRPINGTTATTAPFIAQLFGNAAGGDTNRDRMYRGGSTGTSHISNGLVASTGASNYSANVASQSDEAKILSIYRNGTNNAVARIIRASGLEWSASPAVVEYREPEHICIGARHAAVAPGGFRDLYGPVRMISAVLIQGSATDVELQNWLLNRDARTVFGVRLWGYWVASTINGSTIPNQIVGKPDMTMYGLTSADLVAL
jgi:hypothetical protein